MKARDEIQVLIVEDNYLVSEMTQGILKELGYQIAGEAVNGLEAVEMTKQLQPDVVVMDIKMPDMDGLEATSQIYECCPTPVVVLTAYETPNLVEQASAAGVGAYLVKPPNASEMERAITIAMARFENMVELHRINADLQARNEELDTFAHTVAHDLQSPLNLILGYANILKDEARLPEEMQHYLNTIIRTGHKMSSIVEELQLLTGVRKTKVELKPLNMARIVAEVQQRLAYMIDEYQAKIILPNGWPTALGHAPWIEEVWANYLSNAIKYGGHPPLVKMGATERSDGMIRFWIQDNGCGLPPQQQKRLFKPFNKLDHIRATGHGLGLSIVRRIIEKLGGEVGFKSEAVPGEGSVFFFTLPSADQ